MAKRSRSSVNYFDRRYLCEFAGTLMLVLIGCGSIAIGGFGATSVLQIGIAFGLTIVGVAYSIGAISGAHLNPAVTASMWSAGRIRSTDALAYIFAQCIGAIAGAAILMLILYTKSGNWTVTNLGQNGWAPAGFGTAGAIITEFVATLIFTLVILGATANRGATAMAGLVIGLTLIALHLVFFNVTGLSVNPARSLAPALFVGGGALTQLWLFLVVPTIAGLVAGWLSKEEIFG